MVSIPQIEIKEKRTRSELKSDIAVMVLKILTVTLFPMWVVGCLSSLMATPIIAVAVRSSYGNVWPTTTAAIGAAVAVLVVAFLANNPHYFRKDWEG